MNLTQQELAASAYEQAQREFDTADQAYLAAKIKRELALAAKQQAYLRYVEASIIEKGKA